LGTGGTIAGRAGRADDNVGYQAAQLGVDRLLQEVPGLAQLAQGHALVAEQVVQVDSKDMQPQIWQTLVLRVAQYLARDDVRAVIITHGTDTLEETAFFLHAVLPATLINRKPVVLTCAMRPATALSPDGPQNLRDAVAVALAAGAHGVLVVCAGRVHAGLTVQKDHTYRLDAFSSGDAGALACVEEGAVRPLAGWPSVPASQDAALLERVAGVTDWPRVEVVLSHAGASGAVVDALLLPQPSLPPMRGLVVAGTGNGTVHQALEAALRRAVQAGVRVVRASRCAGGRVIASAHGEFAHSNGLSPVKARVALMLALMGD